jgi:hypothetical protein
MRFSRLLLCLAFAPLLASCSSASKQPTQAHDGSSASDLGLSHDAGLEAARLPQDLATSGDLKTDVAIDAGLDGPLPQDSPLASDLGPDASGSDIGGPDAADADTAGACLWQTSGGRYTLDHFSFLLTTPDGQEQFPPSTARDSGSYPINDFQGRIVSAEGNRFAVDSCLSASSCQPSLYSFSLCNTSQSLCQLDSSHSSIQIAIPLERLVRVVWHMDMDAPGFSPGLFWLAIYDGEPGATNGNILFLGSGGYKPGYPAGATVNHLSELPFSVTLRPLNCGGSMGDASPARDDYAFEFMAKNDAGVTLELATGEIGSFQFTAGSGPTQRLQVHCLDAVQPAATDDYWNWDFWAADETVVEPLPPDAGGF